MSQLRTLTEVGAALPPLTKTITQTKIDAYARASGDINPLHLDPEFAASTQFGGIIAHGMLVLAYLSEMLTGAFGQRWITGGRLKVRFRAPARPDDVVTAYGEVTSVTDRAVVCSIECRSAVGEVLISGEAEVPA